MPISLHPSTVPALVLAFTVFGCAAPASTSSSASEVRVPAPTGAPASAATAHAADELADLRREAGRAFQEQSWADAAELYARIVAAEPKNATAWFRRGYALHSLRDYAGSARAFERSCELQPHPTAAYDVACARARLGEPKPALAWLAKSVELGFRDLAALAMDDDLATLRVAPEFEALVERVRNAVHPCEARAESRQLDFWAGEWNVTTAGGAPAGSSRVERILDGCALLEHWSGRDGSSGKSFSLYDASSAQWKQTWIDGRGTLTVFAGAPRADGAMVFVADVPAPDGAGRAQRRMTFSKLDGGRVRQHGELSKDGGATWSTEYDFVYAPTA
ncbi:MAG: tetratricopeptide repeat protein [Planctomycetes bacterium]|nr:tetratricopeptide repeat protein [Planctomycetota bacterium]